MMKKENRKIYYVFSPFLRIFHWTLVVSCAVLFVTGIFITHPISVMALEPTYTNMYTDLVRNIHLVAAFIFSASIMLRIYGFLINPGDRLMPRMWECHFNREVIDVSMHYQFMKYEHRPYLRNPMARMSYGGFYVMAFVEILTGFAIYYMDSNTWIADWILSPINISNGGIYMSRLMHHYVAWFIILVAIGHIYMVFRADFMDGEGEASSMISGIKIYRHTPDDVEELEEEGHSEEYWKRVNKKAAEERSKKGY